MGVRVKNPKRRGVHDPGRQGRIPIHREALPADHRCARCGHWNKAHDKVGCIWKDCPCLTHYKEQECVR